MRERLQSVATLFPSTSATGSCYLKGMMGTVRHRARSPLRVSVGRLRWLPGSRPESGVESRKAGDAVRSGSEGTGWRGADAYRTPDANALRNPFGDGFFGASAHRAGLNQTAKPLFYGSFSGRNVCWGAWREISPATGPNFWEATGVQRPAATPRNPREIKHLIGRAGWIPRGCRSPARSQGIHLGGVHAAGVQRGQRHRANSIDRITHDPRLRP